MPSVKTLLTLGRISNLPTVWMNVLSAAVLSVALTPTALDPCAVLWVLLAMSCFYAAGVTLDDVLDQHGDAQRQPGRPIPSGRIGARRAPSCGVGLLVVGFAFRALAAWAEGVLVCLALAGVIVL